MGEARRKYPREFKIDAVRRVVEDGRSQAHVARKLGIPANTLAVWKREYLADPEQSFPGNGRQKPDEAELTRLRRENARLKRENEIFKKKRRRTSRESRGEVCVCERTAIHVSGG